MCTHALGEQDWQECRQGIRWWLLGVLVLAFALRVPLLNGPRFHPDEALFASFARGIAVWRDPLLASAPVDKPPLLFYLQALCYPFLGPKEMAARMPNLFASLLTIPLTFAITESTFKSAVKSSYRIDSFISLTAALFVALSSLAVAFGSTAFTDTLMVMWGMAALLAACRRRPGTAGLLIGLGLLTKYQALLFLPLVLFYLWRFHKRGGKAGWGRFCIGLGLPLAALVAWEWARTGGLTLFILQWRGYGGLSLAPAGEWGRRLYDWSRLAHHIGGSVTLNILVLGAIVAVLLHGLLNLMRSGSWTVGLILSSWLLGFTGLHWMLNVRVWDRYLLPAVPLIALLLGWAIAALVVSRRVPIPTYLIPLALLVLMLPAAGRVAGGEVPVGGDHGTYDGIEQVAEFFAPFPYGTVLYDHWLSWELRYYLFDSRVYVSWFADSTSLGDDLAAFGADPQRFLVVPTWESPLAIVQAVKEAGFHLDPVLLAVRPEGSVSFTVYQIVEPDG